MVSRIARLVVAGTLCLGPLVACSSYDGPVTNAPPPAGSQGTPLLTGGYSP